MTGGQPAEGSFTVAQIAHQLVGRGRQAPRDRLPTIAGKYPANYLPQAPAVHHRRDDGLRRSANCAKPKGVSVLIYDQTCAAEKRRRRKRGPIPDPAKRVFINELVCEGCGDCSQTVQLRVGRSRSKLNSGASASIDQSNVQQGLLLRQRLLPELRDRAWRHAEAPETVVGGCRPIIRRPAAALASPARRPLQRPRHRHRRHRRRHDRRAARHGRPSRRPRLLGARRHRPRAKERRGDEPCPDRTSPGRASPASASPPATPTSFSAATSWCRRAPRR